ncbi:hypothetical protein POM88_029238 [Heracleum sosnowskyi]|uniref:Uncharacterized protein n=1 Tax=Heracleum sosnowskyi TaxID=360622 RepID=A0AAD8HW07_9APIA|nr:hypothetical protein POM88_029238 [Heracleum sosnowskyi]
MERIVVVDQNRNGENRDNGRGSSSCRVLRDISRNIHCGDGILPTPDIKTCKTPVGKVSSRLSPSSDFNKCLSDEGKSSNRNGKNRDNGGGSSSCRVLRDISRNIHCGDGILPTPDIKTCKTPVGKVSYRFSPSSDFNKSLLDEGKSSNRNGKNQDNGRGSSSCRVLSDISRNIQCGDGILPTPDIKTCKTPVGKVSSRFSPSSDFNKSPSDEGKSSNRKSKGLSLKKGSSVPFNSPSSGFIKSPSDEGKSSNEKSNGSSLKKGSSVPFNIKVDCDKENYLYCKKLSYSERWAGPAYSNSPPPSSLPMPKFCVPSKVSVSLELACLESEIHLQPTSRSAPPSPKREHGDSTRNGFRSADDASVTKDLCRILNLDMTDE